jgi:hypothetical protein
MNSLVADHYIRGLNGDTKFGRYFNYFGIRVLIWCEWDATETHTMLATVEGDEILQNLPQITARH